MKVAGEERVETVRDRVRGPGQEPRLLLGVTTRAAGQAGPVQRGRRPVDETGEHEVGGACGANLGEEAATGKAGTEHAWRRCHRYILQASALDHLSGPCRARQS